MEALPPEILEMFLKGQHTMRHVPGASKLNVEQHVHRINLHVIWTQPRRANWFDFEHQLYTEMGPEFPFLRYACAWPSSDEGKH